jgi:hypothetical protein
MKRWCVLATVMGLLLVLAPSAGAETVQLPVGEAHGVRIVRERGAIVVVFTPRAARLWRRVAGKRVSVFCEERSGPDEDGFVTVSDGGTTFRAPRRGRRLRTGDLTRAAVRQWGRAGRGDWDQRERACQHTQRSGLPEPHSE